uniref:Uncharacterized protein n=1 Tax=Aegilops tauschii subsp. strangulata TaxID=200361 RepID=A0A453SDC3_AEGTS
MPQTYPIKYWSCQMVLFACLVCCQDFGYLWVLQCFLHKLFPKCWPTGWRVPSPNCWQSIFGRASMDDPIFKEQELDPLM